MKTMIDGYPDDFARCDFFGGSLDGTLQIVPKYMLVKGFKYTNFGPYQQKETYVYREDINSFVIDRDIY